MPRHLPCAKRTLRPNRVRQRCAAIKNLDHESYVTTLHKTSQTTCTLNPPFLHAQGVPLSAPLRSAPFGTPFAGVVHVGGDQHQ